MRHRSTQTQTQTLSSAKKSQKEAKELGEKIQTKEKEKQKQKIQDSLSPSLIPPRVSSKKPEKETGLTSGKPKIDVLKNSKEFRDASSIVHHKLVEMLKESQKFAKSLDSPSKQSFYSPEKRNHQKFAAQKIIAFQKRLLFDDAEKSLWGEQEEKTSRFGLAEEFEPPQPQPQRCKEKEAKQIMQSAKRGVTSGVQDHSSKTRQVFFLDQSCLNSLLSTKEVEDFVETKLSSFLEDGLQWTSIATEEASREVFKQAIRWFDWPRYVQGDSVIWGHSPDPSQEDPGFFRGLEGSSRQLSTKQMIDSIDPESNIPVRIGEKITHSSSTNSSSAFSTSPFFGKGKEGKKKVFDEKSRVIAISDVLLKGKTKEKAKTTTNSISESQRQQYLQGQSSVFPLKTEEDEIAFARHVQSDSFWVKDLRQKKKMFERAKETKGKGFMSFFLNRKSKEEAPLFKLGVFRYLRIQRTSDSERPESADSPFSPIVPSTYVADSPIPIVVTLAGMFPLGTFYQNGFGLKTLTDARTGLNATVVMVEHQEELVVRSSTVYGAVIKFALACLYASGMLSRGDLVDKYFEKEFLYSLLKNEKTQEETFLNIIRTCIIPYQCTGFLFTEALHQEKELLKSEQVFESLPPSLQLITRATLQTFLSRPIFKMDQLKDYNPFSFAMDRDLYLPNPNIVFS